MKRYLIDISVPVLLAAIAICVMPARDHLSVMEGLRAFIGGCLLGVAINIAYERGRRDAIE
jgi:hypothetical protein